MNGYDSKTLASPTLLYLEDLVVGQRFTSGIIEVEKDRMVSFAAEFDPQPFHLSDDLAKGTLFLGLAASGWHTGALTMRLLVDGGLPFAGGLVGANAEIQWPRPTRPGDVLHVDTEILDITASKSHPERGSVTVRCETRNQRNEAVQILKIRLIVPRRPA
ncbi:MAG: MaoC family dehydratase [Caulobacteraceae bacterium]|nr:MaoC family dehydratase [Caulobacteraceae bacterium]